MKRATCYWCGQEIVDGREWSGYIGPGPDWATPDGDFGCDDSPGTDDTEGVGNHMTWREVKELVAIVERQHPSIWDKIRHNLYPWEEE